MPITIKELVIRSVINDSGNDSSGGTEVSERESLKAVADAGVEVIYPPKEPFAETVASIYKDYENNPEIADLIKRIRAEEINDTLSKPIQ